MHTQHDGGIVEINSELLSIEHIAYFLKTCVTFQSPFKLYDVLYWRGSVAELDL